MNPASVAPTAGAGSRIIITNLRHTNGIDHEVNNASNRSVQSENGNNDSQVKTKFQVRYGPKTSLII